MKLSSILLVIIVLIGVSRPVQGQPTYAAFPSLLFQPSSYLNGQGGTGTSVLTDDPFAFASNPAQLGSWSKSNNFASHFYTNKVDWFANNFVQQGLAFNNQAFAVGMNFRHILHDMDVSIGLGYVNSVFDRGTVIFSGNPGSFQAADIYDLYQSYAIGVGVHSFIDLSAGFTFKHAVYWYTDNAEFRKDIGDHKTNIADYGVLLTVPVHNLVLTKDILGKNERFSPFLNLSMGLARRNQGGDFNFSDGWSYPTPRLASLGYSINLGTDININENTVRLLTITWTTEADRVLINPGRSDTASGNWSPKYISGLGGISVIRNLIKREGDREITCRHGFGLEIGEAFTLNRGSFSGGGYEYNKTYGFSVKAAGIVKLLNCIIKSPILDYMATHFDVQFHQGTQYWTTSRSFPGMDYNGIVLLVRGYSFDHNFKQ